MPSPPSVFNLWSSFNHTDGGALDLRHTQSLQRLCNLPIRTGHGECKWEPQWKSEQMGKGPRTWGTNLQESHLHSLVARLREELFKMSFL